MATPSTDGPGAAPTNLAVAPVSAPKKHSFFDLPYEVRLEIYEMLFCYCRLIRLTLSEDGKVRVRRHNYGGPVLLPVLPVQAFTVAKKIHKEASPILYSRNTFAMDWENLNTFLSKWEQEVSSSVRALKVLCLSGPAWGFVPATRVLVDKMPGLREINFEHHSPYRLAAAALETSNAITPCAPMFQGQGPDLELVVQPGHMSSFNPGEPGSDLDAIWTAMTRGNVQLAGIWPKDLPTSYITRPCAANLSLIKVSGRVSRSVLSRILQYRCLPGDCFWKNVGTEGEDGLCHYKWQAMDPRERTDIQEVNMRQWQPPLTAKEWQTVRGFAEAFEKRDHSSQDDKSTSGEHETAGDNPEGASEANALPNGHAGLRDPELTDDGETSDNVSSADAGGKESGAPGETESATTAPAAPEERLQDLQELPFADCFDEFDLLGRHLNVPADVRAFMLETFRTLTLDLSQPRPQPENLG